MRLFIWRIPAYLTLLSAAQSMAQTYRIQELPPPVRTGHSFGVGLNDEGVVVGNGLTSSGNRALRWINGAPTVLGALPGHGEAIAYDINTNGQIIGRSGPVCGESAPMYMDAGPLQALPAIPRLDVYVYTVSGSGIAVGEGVDSCSRPWNNAAYRWAYDPNAASWTVAPLAQLAGDAESGAYDVNESGAIVGFSGDSGGAAHLLACRWDDGVPSLLPDLGGDHSIAIEINDADQFVGYSRTPTGEYRAYFFNGESAINLGTLTGYSHSAAGALNNAGVVVGHAFNGTAEDTIFPYLPPPQTRAFVWRDGQMHPLISLIPASAGWSSLNRPRKINERGQITGEGRKNGLWRGFLLTPNVLADLNCDDTVDFFDIDPFLLALFAPGDYAAQYPSCDIRNADINADNSMDFFDIDPFLDCLFGSCP